MSENQLYFLTGVNNMNITYKVQQYIQKTQRGKPFASSALMKLGARTAVDKAVSRLVASGKILRVTQGIYVRPEENRFVGQVLPEPFKVAQVIAKKTNEHIQINGAEAARQLGLSTQVPAQPVFLTTGQSRQFNLGSLKVTLKHVSRKKIPLVESKAGLAILALWHLGKNLVTVEIIEKIELKLSPQEFKKFITSTEYMPAWMSKIIFQYKSQRK